jgi:hypothetical protein
MRILAAAPILAFVLITPIAAYAGDQVAELRKSYRAACKADIEKYCSSAEKKGACLKEHTSEITQDCKIARKAYRTAKKAVE